VSAEDALTNAVADIDAQLDTIKRQRKESAERCEQAHLLHKQKVAEWTATFDEVMAAGGVPPEHPAEPDLSGEDELIVRLQSQETTLKAERQQRTAQARPEIETAARAEAGRIRDDTAEALQVLLDGQARVKRMLGVMTRVRGDHDREYGRRGTAMHSAQTRKPLTLDEFVSFVAGDLDPLALIDPLRRPTQVEKVLPSTDEKPKAAPLGYTHQHGLNVPADPRRTVDGPSSRRR
jgi:hypothetical protein